MYDGMYVRESESDPPLGLPLVLRDHVLGGKLKRITLGVQINVQVQISVWAGNFGKTNKHTGPNKRTG